MNGLPVSPRGRRPLGAHIAGWGAVWLYAQIGPRFEGSIRDYLEAGDVQRAQAVGEVQAELREAARQAWAATGRGNAEALDDPPPARSAVPPSGGVHCGRVDVRGASEVLALSERRVRQLLAAGTLRGEHDRTGRWSVDIDDLDRLRADRKATP